MIDITGLGTCFFIRSGANPVTSTCLDAAMNYLNKQSHFDPNPILKTGPHRNWLKMDIEDYFDPALEFYQDWTPICTI